MPVVEAARALGISQQAVRDRIKRETLETRLEVVGNRSRLLVKVDPDSGQGAAQALEQRLVEALLPRLERALEQQVAKRLEDKEAHIADLRAEVERLSAELARRRWPGLVAVVKQLLNGN